MSYCHHCRYHSCSRELTRSVRWQLLLHFSWNAYAPCDRTTTSTDQNSRSAWFVNLRRTTRHSKTGLFLIAQNWSTPLQNELHGRSRLNWPFPSDLIFYQSKEPPSHWVMWGTSLLAQQQNPYVYPVSSAFFLKTYVQQPPSWCTSAALRTLR